VRRADAEIPVVLDRHADEAGDRIREFLGQFGCGCLPGADAVPGSSTASAR